MKEQSFTGDANVKRPIPVILDTDIGDDIDDTRELAMLLKSPQLAPTLIVGDTADTRTAPGFSGPAGTAADEALLG
jgi:hypothetical protein